MIYLSGVTTSVIQARLLTLGVGLMLDALNSRDPAVVGAFAAWAADNGAFSSRRVFDLDAWLAWLARYQGQAATCLFAVAPDVLCDAEATLARSTPVLPRIRALGFPVAYVSQDGATAAQIPWDDIDVLFTGGSTAWKLSEPAYALAREARRRDKRTHMGRVNSLRRYRAALLSGYDSADGTYIAYNPAQLTERVATWLDLARRPRLPLDL